MSISRASWKRPSTGMMITLDANLRHIRPDQLGCFQRAGFHACESWWKPTV